MKKSSFPFHPSSFILHPCSFILHPCSRKHLVLLIVLWIVALFPRLITVAGSVAPARDGLRYLLAARTLDHSPILGALRSLDVHPLYPLFLHGIRTLFVHGNGPDNMYFWAWAAQCSSVVCYLAFITLAYFAGVGLYGPRISFLGCLATVILPRQVAYTSDILCESLLAMLWMASIALLIWAWKDGKTWKVTCAGLLAGLAYWIHLQAILLPFIFGAALIGTQFLSRWRWPWKRWGKVLVAYLVPYLLVFGTYIWCTGDVSSRLAFRDMTGLPFLGDILNQAPNDAPELHPSSFILHPSSFSQIPPKIELLETHPNPTTSVALSPADDNEHPSSFILPRDVYQKKTISQAVGFLILELSKETRGWLLALVGIALVTRRRTRAKFPSGLLMFFSVSGYAAMLLLLQIRCGYVAGRYLTPVLPLLGMYAMTGAEALLLRLRMLPRLWWERNWDRKILERRRTIVGACGLLILGLGLCVPGWLKPLHQTRSGHLRAAEWLAKHSLPNDYVFDPSGYCSFFADRPQWEGQKRIPASSIRFATIDPVLIHRTYGHTQQMIDFVDRTYRLVAKFPRSPGDERIGIYIFENPLMRLSGIEDPGNR